MLIINTPKYVLSMAVAGLFSLAACKTQEWDLGQMRVAEVSPQPDASNVPVDTKISVTFTKSIAQAGGTMTLLLDNAAVPGSASANGKKIVFTPQKKLRYGSKYKVVISGTTRDENGNELGQDYHWFFETKKPKTWHTYFGSPAGLLETPDIVTMDDGGFAIVASSSADIPQVDGIYPKSGYIGTAIPAYDAVIAKFTQYGELEWYSFVGTPASTWIRKIKKTPDGGIILSGYTDSVPKIVGSQQPRMPYVGGTTGIILKLSASGDVLWHTYISSTGGGNAADISIGEDGSIFFMGGVTTNTPPLGGIAPVLSWSGAIAGKLDASGNLVWYTFMKISQKIAATKDGGCMLVGVASSFDPVGSQNIPGFSPINPQTTPADMTMIKLNSSGQVAWYTFYPGTNYPSEIIETREGDFVVTGFGLAPFFPGYAPVIPGNGDTMIARFSSNGNLIWYSYFNLNLNISDGRSVMQTAEGGFVLISSGLGPLSNLGIAAPLMPYSCAREIFVAKLTDAGALSWHTYLGNTSSSGCTGGLGNAVAEASDGGYVIAGIGGKNIVTPLGEAPVSQFPGTGQKVFLAKMTPAGSF